MTSQCNEVELKIEVVEEASAIVSHANMMAAECSAIVADPVSSNELLPGESAAKRSRIDVESGAPIQLAPINLKIARKLLEKEEDVPMNLKVRKMMHSSPPHEVAIPRMLSPPMSSVETNKLLQSPIKVGPSEQPSKSMETTRVLQSSIKVEPPINMNTSMSMEPPISMETEGEKTTESTSTAGKIDKPINLKVEFVECNEETEAASTSEMQLAVIEETEAESTSEMQLAVIEETEVPPASEMQLAVIEPTIQLPPTVEIVEPTVVTPPTEMETREEWSGEMIDQQFDDNTAAGSSGAKVVEINTEEDAMDEENSDEATDAAGQLCILPSAGDKTFPFTCPQCPGKVFKKENHLKHHQDIMHAEMDIEVEGVLGESKEKDYIVNIQQPRRSGTKRKSSSNEQVKKAFKCHRCNRRYMNKTSLNAHLKKPCEEEAAELAATRPHKCGMCEKRYKCERSLKTHLREHLKVSLPKQDDEQNTVDDDDEELSDTEKPHKCPDCPLRYMNKTSMVRHQRTHNQPKLPPTPRSQIKPEDKTHHCPHCEKSYKNKTHLTRHMLIHDEKKRHQCPECFLTVASNDEYRRHLKTHTAEKPFKCDQCGMCFKVAYHLRTHSYSHLETADYKCETCPKSFKSPMLLNAHQLVHNKDKKLKCSKCDRRFHRKSEVRSHERSHDKLKPYRCEDDMCGKWFKHQLTCNQHIEKFRLPQPLSCVRCEFSSGFLCGFEKHVKECEKNKNKQIREISFPLD